MMRRGFLKTMLGFGGVLGAAAAARGLSAQAAEGEFPVRMSEEEWRARLSPDAFAVLRKEATERPYSSPLNANKASGLYACAGCDAPLYPSRTKFDSGTGWPSFWAPVSEDAIGTTVDYKLIYPRTEVHCARCGGHLGHIFDDGPRPTGKRHCINGVALAFHEGSPEDAAG